MAPKRPYYEKLEYRAWKADTKLGYTKLATRGVWVEWLFAMMESGAYSLTGTLDELATVARTTDIEAVILAIKDMHERDMADFGFPDESNANVTQKITHLSRSFNGRITVVNRRRERELKPKELNRLRQAKFRKKSESNAEITPYSNSNSKGNSNELPKEREPASPPPPPEEPIVPFGADSKWQNPAVVLFEEIFKVRVGTNFAVAVIEQVTDLELWKTLLNNKRAYADRPLEERKRVCNWILDEYGKRLKEKSNETNRKSYQEQAADRATAEGVYIAGLRQKSAERRAGVQRGDDADSSRLVRRQLTDGHDGGEGESAGRLGIPAVSDHSDGAPS